MIFSWKALKEYGYFLSSKIYLFLIVLCFFQATEIFAQSTGAVSGVLKDENGMPLEFISVALIKSSDSVLIKGTLTDSSGRFTFEQLALDSYQVHVNYIGYQSYNSPAFTLSEHTSDLNLGEFTLIAIEDTLQTITVMGRKKPLVEQQADRTVLNVENSILSEGNTALEVLEKAPGIMVDNDGNITLKGKPGVMVMINGKQTYLSQRELTALLRGTSSSSIAKVEIISNPSSKYDAAGNAGIINIVMKKNVKLGLNGNVYANAGTSRRFRHGYGMALNYRSGRFNWFGSYDYTDRGEKEFQENNRKFENSRVSYQTSTSLEPLYTNNFKLGADFNINDKNTIGVLVNGNIGSYSNKSESKNLVLDEMQFVSDARSYNYTREGWNSLTYSVNYTKLFKKEGREFSTDFSYSDNRFNSTQVMNTRFLDIMNNETGSGFIRRGSLPSLTKIYMGKADYTHPIGKTAKFETGWKSSFVAVENDVRYDTLAGSDWQNDATMTNRFNYKETINAAYVNFSKEFGKYTLQAGLRLEQTHTEGHQVTIDSVVTRDYMQMFPSLFLKRVLTEKQSLHFSYSRRIERPDYGDLNPFRFYRDPYLYYTGNPFLQPQFSNAFELSHDFNAKVMTAASYSVTDGVIAWQVGQVDSSNTTYEGPRNLRRLSSYGISCTVNLSFTKWWSGNIFGNLNYNEFKDEDITNAITSYSFNIQQSLTLGKGFSMEVTGTYNSETVYGIYIVSPMYWMSMGIQKQLLKKATIKLSVNDIFQTKRFSEQTTYQNVNMNTTVRLDSRNIMLSLSYRFGNNAFNKTRKSDADEVRSRVKGAN